MKKECTEQKTDKQKKSKMKDLRTMVILTCTCILMLGSATYAWFSMSNTPRVENLALVAGTTGNLQIADTIGGNYGEMLNLQNNGSGGNMSSVILNPATTTNGVDFLAPVYTENEVTGTAQIAESDLKTKYIYEKIFYLKADVQNSQTSNRTFDIFFLANSSNGGTYISNKTINTDQAASAVRLSFTVGEGNGATTIIYEPNVDTHVTGEQATNSLNAQYGGYSTIKQNSGRSFVDGAENYSPRLFTITENTPVKVTMRVWIEGTDADCVNAIAADNIIGQIQFVSKETMTTP